MPGKRKADAQRSQKQPAQEQPVTESTEQPDFNLLTAETLDPTIHVYGRAVTMLESAAESSCCWDEERRKGLATFDK